MIVDSARRIVIGDVHGHFQGLKHLLSCLDLREQDELYFLGDLVDRGPQSAQVVEWVRTHNYCCLMGNHEQMMLSALNASRSDYLVMEGWFSAGGRSTLSSYMGLEEQLQIDLQWMATLPSYIDLGDLWLVHAGVNPNLPLETQNTQEFCWIRQEFHQMREPFFPDKVIVTGHTITFTFADVAPGQIVQGPGWLGIDTGAYHPRSGWMTAVDFTRQQVYQVNVYNEQERIRTLSESITPIQPTKPRSISAKKLLSYST